MKKKIFVFLFDGFSDWEISYFTPEINKSEDFELVYFSKNGGVVSSMGGMQVKTEISLSDINAKDIEMLVLPGGEAWEKGVNNEIIQLTKQVFDQNKWIAAICAATTFLGQLGLLDDLKHTSNDLYYLKAIVPNYRGEKYYQNQRAVSDNQIITACGIAPIEFAREIFDALSLYDKNKIEQWFQLFKNGVWNG